MNGDVPKLNAGTCQIGAEPTISVFLVVIVLSPQPGACLCALKHRGPTRWCIDIFLCCLRPVYPVPRARFKNLGVVNCVLAFRRPVSSESLSFTHLQVLPVCTGTYTVNKMMMHDNPLKKILLCVHCLVPRTDHLLH